MGGKTWSREEERLLWEVIVPRSKDAAYPIKDCLDWTQLAKLMNELAGDIARRKYTKNMIYEHFFQNKQPGHTSPKAAEFVEKYLLDAAYFKEHGCSRPPSPSNPSTPAKEPLDPQLVDLLKGEAKPKSKSKARRPRKVCVPWERETEGQPSRPFFSMPKTLDEIGAYSVTPGNAAQQQPSGGYTTSTRAESTQSNPYPFPNTALVAVPGSGSAWNQPVDGLEVDRSQVAGHPATAFERNPKAGPGFSRQPVAESMEGRYWHAVPSIERGERSRETLPMASGSISAQPRPQAQAPGYVSSWAHPTPSRQRTPQEQWNGRLPSIREMLPYEFGQPAYDPYAHEIHRRVDKHSFSTDQDYAQIPDSTPKRRRLPDAPVRGPQGEEQQYRRQD